MTQIQGSKFSTPLRYPGGKSKFAPFIAKLMLENGLSKGHYLEPYAGGAGVALELLFHGHASHIHINDFDPAIFSFWSSVTKYPDEILRLLNDTPLNMDQWFKWRSILRGEVKADVIETGFATLFMNRTNRSGILKGGVIGGKNQDGIYKLDARFNKPKIAERIQKIANYANHISVYKEDAFTLLNRASKFLPKKSLIYLDPPYYVKGKGLYRNFYEHDDHLEISLLLQQKKFSLPWVVSYDNASQICDMYQFSQNFKYSLNYSAQKIYVGNEVMFFSPKLNIPENDFIKFKAVA